MPDPNTDFNSFLDQQSAVRFYHADLRDWLGEEIETILHMIDEARPTILPSTSPAHTPLQEVLKKTAHTTDQTSIAKVH